jgi:hypothetical protein
MFTAEIGHVADMYNISLGICLYVHVIMNL